MSRCFCVAVFIFLLAGISGCRGSFPNWFRPGTAERQRLNASYHDPYADQNLGPEVVGGRPRDYREQRPEPVRDQPYYRQYP